MGKTKLSKGDVVITTTGYKCVIANLRAKHSPRYGGQTTVKIRVHELDPENPNLLFERFIERCDIARIKVDNEFVDFE